MGKYTLQRLTFNGRNESVITSLTTVDTLDNAKSVISEDLFDVGDTIHYIRITEKGPKTLLLDTGQYDRFYLVQGEDLFDFTHGK